MWHERYFELNKGFLQWWVSEADARHGIKPNGTVYLLGLKQTFAEKVFKVTAVGTKGVVYSFSADNDEHIVEWMDRLWAHASYCEEIKNFLETRQAQVQEEALLARAREDARELSNALGDNRSHVSSL